MERDRSSRRGGKGAVLPVGCPKALKKLRRTDAVCPSRTCHPIAQNARGACQGGAKQRRAAKVGLAGGSSGVIPE